MSDYHDEETSSRRRATTFTIDDEYAYYSIERDERRTSPEKRLLIAWLERALADALYSVGRMPAKSSMRDSIKASKKWSNNAICWILEKPDIDSFNGSFEWVCLHLDLDCNEIRKKVINARIKKIRFIRNGGRAGSNNKLRLCINQ